MFQTPSAGRWVLQQPYLTLLIPVHHLVSNPISGEVGAAARVVLYAPPELHSMFQTPSAGRWVLQHQKAWALNMLIGEFQTPSAGRWVLQLRLWKIRQNFIEVSNPISGEVGAAADEFDYETCEQASMFQTPSAGRWVLQLGLFLAMSGLGFVVSNPISGEVGAAARIAFTMRCGIRSSFKPHQRGGGCCSILAVNAPSVYSIGFQTPSAGRWVLQHGLQLRAHRWRGVSNPISGEVGAAAIRMKNQFFELSAGFKPHQRGGGYCSWPPCWSRAHDGTRSFKPHQRGGGCSSCP